MSFASLSDKIVGIVDGSIVPLLYALAFLFFMVGILRFFFLGGAENREKGKDFIVWGLLGFFIIFSVWGLVRILISVIAS